MADTTTPNIHLNLPVSGEQDWNVLSDLQIREPLWTGSIKIEQSTIAASITSLWKESGKIEQTNHISIDYFKERR